jgi:hypothetical protein
MLIHHANRVITVRSYQRGACMWVGGGETAHMQWKGQVRGAVEAESEP